MECKKCGTIEPYYNDPIEDGIFFCDCFKPKPQKNLDGYIKKLMERRNDDDKKEAD